MRKKIFFVLCFMLPLLVSAQQHIVSFTVNNRSDVYKLPEYVYVDEIKNNTVVAYLYGENFEKFKELSYSFKELQHPSVGKSLTMATTIEEMANWDKYPTFDVYKAMMNKFVTDYPNLCKLVTVGTTEGGREVQALKISDNPNEQEVEPEFYYTGQIHGDELVSGMMLLRLIDHLLSNYATDADVKNLVDSFEIWINPISNLDGTYAGGNSTVSGATRANANGVDMNRNFPSPNKPNPTYQNEAGVKMQIEFAQAHSFVMSSNIHSGAELVNFPWDSWTSSQRKHADHNWWYHVSMNYANHVHANAPSSYMSGYDNGITHGGDWYVVDGGRQDHMGYYRYCREMTLELSNQKMLDCEDLPAHWTYNKDALIGYIKEANYGIQGTVKNSDGEPLDAKVFIVAHDKDNSEVYTDPDAGDYYRPIEPGTYSVTYSAEGYSSQTHTIVVAGWEQTIKKDVILFKNENVTVSGTVIDIFSGQTVADANLTFGSSDYKVKTNANGQYDIVVPAEEIEITVTKENYITQTLTSTFSGDNITLDFALSPDYLVTFEEEIPSFIIFGGNKPWQKTSDEAYQGTSSIKSGIIGNNNYSLMQATVETPAGTIGFYKKVSCEPDNDKLQFLIDNVVKETWSGEIDWSYNEYPITAGTHTFAWKYRKNGDADAGGDCAWIDNIKLPLKPAKKHSVTFKVLNTANNPVTNAVVNIAGYGSKLADSQGVIEFNDVAEATDSLSVIISAISYKSISKKILVNKNINQTVKLQSADDYKVTFTVFDENNQIVKNAIVKLQDYGTKLTNENGKCTFNGVFNSNDSIKYTCLVTDYPAVIDKIFVNADMNEDIHLKVLANISEYDNNSVNIYPNPSDGIFNISISDNFATVKVFNLMGMLIYQKNIEADLESIDLSDCASGIYLLSVQTKNGVITKKVILK